MMLLPGSFYSATVVVLSWIAGSISQPSIKRASAIALINSICNTPNGRYPTIPFTNGLIADPEFAVWGSYLYYSEPRYLAAFLVNLAASVLAIILATGTRLYLRRQNSKLERGLDTGKNGPTPAQVAAGFRYTIWIVYVCQFTWVGGHIRAAWIHFSFGFIAFPVMEAGTSGVENPHNGRWTGFGFRVDIQIVFFSERWFKESSQIMHLIFIFTNDIAWLRLGIELNEVIIPFVGICRGLFFVLSDISSGELSSAAACN